MKQTNRNAVRPLALLIAALIAPPALAQGVATERELSPVLVTDDGMRAALDPTLPASSHSVTRGELAGQSFINSEDALLYAPNTHVRKRFIGDRNANLSGRSFGSLQPARGLVYVDGYMISNFLGRFDAPRWNVVAPEQIARTDVLYGPFSAIYPGNSIGTTVAISTRQPTEAEASATLQVYRQRHDDYGLERDYDGNQQSAYVANRWGALSASLGLNRLAYHSHPMGYATAVRSTNTSVAGLPVVSGASFDRDSSGQARTVLGATGIQKGVQEMGTLRLAYDFTTELQADVLLAHWRNDYRVSNETLLRDADGNPVWRPTSGSTAVNIDGYRYDLPKLAPERGLDEHYQVGGRLRTLRPTGWNHSVQVSRYALDRDGARKANVSDPFAGGVVAGTDTRRDGTGWQTFELQSTYTPAGAGGHKLTFGYHQNNYVLRNRVFTLSDWHDGSTRTGESENYFGKTELRALYAQDAWEFDPDWVATFGLRAERFRAYDGSQFIASASPATVRYADRKASALSPKLSLAHVLSDEWLLRASYGRGVRFPTVSELFQGSRSGSTIVSNDPGLDPERSDALELSAIQELGWATLRLSLYQDDVRDVIYLQNKDLGGGVTTSTVQNVDRVRTRGLELAFRARDVWLPGLGFDASLAFNRARILSNSAVPESEGKLFPRIPKVRASLHASYDRGAWQGSLGVRHSGTQYSTLDNSDTHADTFGGVSSFTVVDAKLGYRFGRQGRLAVGIDNLTDRRYYVHHPYPGRTVYAELQLSY